MIISELKKDAKIKLTGNYGKSLLIYIFYFVIIFLTSFLGIYIKNDLIYSIYQIIVLIFTVPLSFGVVASIMKITRNDDVGIIDFIKIGFKNIKGVWRTVGRTFLKLIIPILFLTASFVFLFSLFIQNFVTLSNTAIRTVTISELLVPNFVISFILVIVAIIYTIYKSLSYSLSYYILFDNPEATGTEVVEKSKSLMKNNKLNLVLLTLSFIIWYMAIYLIGTILSYVLGNISTIITTLLSILLVPYITATTICFYEELLSEDNNNK